MFKNIVNLTKILSKDLLSKLEFINIDNKRINKKNMAFWFLLTVVTSLSFISYKSIYFLRKINQSSIFLNVYWTMISIIITFQVILISLNNYYFSHELNNLLPLPIKPKELLIAKFLTILFNMYISEMIFLLFPMLIYGIMTYGNLLYYIYLMGILVIFPVLPILVISILMSICIKFSKLIKNKNIFHIMAVFALTACTFFMISKVLSSLILETNGQINNEQIVDYITNFNNQIQNGNKFFIQVNDIVNILENRKIIGSIRFLRIIFIGLLLFFTFIFMEEKFYIRDILKNNSFNKIKKLPKLTNIKISKKINKKISYFNKEVKVLFRNPTFFIQCVFPTLILIFVIIIFTIKLVPSIRTFLEWEELEGRINLKYSLKMAGAIMFLAQIVFTMSNISITGISREGKNAKLMKNFPMKLYDQFICKAWVQIIFNNFFLIIAVLFLHNVLPEIPLVDLLFIFMILILLNIINSKLMLLIDLIKPNINWDSEYEINKNQNNKIFQYAFSIAMILLITYLVKVLNGTNLIMSYLVFIDIFMLLLFIINFIVKLNIKKLFNKIDR